MSGDKDYEREPGQHGGDRDPAPDAGRRGVLRAGAALAAFAGGAIVPARGFAAEGAQPLAVPDWMHRQGRPILSPPYGVPSRFEKDVVRRAREQRATDTASASFTPLQDGFGIITPNGLCFERHHAGVPDIDPELHRLVIHGLVERPLIFTMDDVMRLPSASRVAFIECAGNTQNWKNSHPGFGVQQTHGLLMCCEWTGVMLSTLLDQVGVKPEAKWLLAEGADAAALTRSVPIEKALDDAMVVYGQNGERLRPEQGYPLRLLLPGFEGNTNVKWLRRLKLGTEPWQTRDETSKYTELMPDGTARQFAFVMQTKSAITRPSGGQHLASGPGFYEVTGLAWSGRGRIRKVEVSTDGGTSWGEAQLQEPVLPKALVRFRFPWQWNGGPAALQSRATDETGAVQPSHAELIAAVGARAFYHYNAIQTWRIGSDGKVSFDVA